MAGRSKVDYLILSTVSDSMGNAVSKLKGAVKKINFNPQPRKISVEGWKKQDRHLLLGRDNVYSMAFKLYGSGSFSAYNPDGSVIIDKLTNEKVDMGGFKKQKRMSEVFDSVEQLVEAKRGVGYSELLKKAKPKISKMISQMDGGGASWEMDRTYKYAPKVTHNGDVTDVDISIVGDYGYPIGKVDGKVVSEAGYGLELSIVRDKDGVFVSIVAEPSLDRQRRIEVTQEAFGKKELADKDLVKIIGKAVGKLDRKIPDLDEYEAGDEEERVIGQGGFSRWSNPSMFRK